MTLTGANSTFSSPTQTANYTKNCWKQKIILDLDEFLLSVKTDEFDYNSLMAIQKRFFKEFHRSPKQIVKRVRREGVLNFAKRRLNPSAQKNAGIA